jgi:Nucleoside-diphosphate-sugar epimerases
LRDFTYVDDCVDAMLMAAQLPQAAGRIYNIGGEKNVSLLTLARLLIEANGNQGEYVVRQFPEERKR